MDDSGEFHGGDCGDYDALHGKSAAFEAGDSHRTGVLVVEDQLIVRQGIRALLESDSRLLILGEAGSGHGALKELRRLAPGGIRGVVLMDLAMPLLDGLTATRQLMGEFRGWRVLVLSACCGPDELEQAVQSGAAGCVSKETSATELVEAILKVAGGGSVFGPEFLGHLVGICRRERPLRVEGHLTGREREVLRLVADGYANKQIASELGISIKTVEKHRQHLMDKLNLHQTAGLTRYALEHGLVESPTRFQTPGLHPPAAPSPSA